MNYKDYDDAALLLLVGLHYWEKDGQHLREVVRELVNRGVRPRDIQQAAADWTGAEQIDRRVWQFLAGDADVMY